MIYKKILTQAEFSIVTLSEAKAQCRLTSSFTKDDDYITSLIEVCSELAQNYTNRLLSVGDVALVSESYEPYIALYGGEIESIDTVTGVNLDGQEIDITDFSFSNITQKIKLPLDFASYYDITVQYSCGYVNVPKKVKQGVLMMIASMYNNREDGLVGQSYESLPMTSLKLLDSVRM